MSEEEVEVMVAHEIGSAQITREDIEYAPGQVKNFVAIDITHGCCGKREGFIITVQNARLMAAALLEAANDPKHRKEGIH